MATTEITQSIKDITGESTLGSHVVEDAQRFVSVNIPKDLLENLIDRAGNSTDGAAMSAPANDSIVDVQRDGYSCKKVPLSDAKWVADSSSLKYATNKHPVYYHEHDGGIKIIPVTAGGAAGYYYFIDSSKIDDDSDLRNIVINHAAAKEFSSLAKTSTFPTITWSDITPPTAPDAPSFTTVNIATQTAPTFTAPDWNPPDWQDIDNWINTEEDSEMAAVRVQTINSQIQEFNSNLQNAQADFNAQHAEYEALVQEATQESTLNKDRESQEYSAKLSKYQNEISSYAAQINETVNFNQGKIAEWQSEYQIKLSHYLQMSAQYYNWCMSEIKMYIENHPKTLLKISAMRSQQGGG